MNCPRCQTAVLDQRERDGVTIDACNRCRGIWLDRGELEKLVAYAAREMDEYSGDFRRNDDYDGPPSSHKRHDRREPHRKRRWFETLGDLFD